jgi:hypothetical protein
MPTKNCYGTRRAPVTPQTQTSKIIDIIQNSAKLHIVRATTTVTVIPTQSEQTIDNNDLHQRINTLQKQGQIHPENTNTETSRSNYLHAKTRHIKT